MKKIIIALGVCILIVGILFVVLPFISIPRPFDFTVYVPKSQILLGEHFVVPPSNVTHSIFLNAGDNVSMIVSVGTDGEINASANDVIDFSVNDGSQTYLSYTKISHLPYNFVWTVPNSANYSFVYDNSFSTTSKNVIVQLTKYWTDPEHHSLTLNSPLIPSAFAYVGAVVVVAGVGAIVFGVVKKSKEA